MTLKECYNAIGGDYESVVARLMTESLVQKFMLKFLDDASYDTLLSSLESGNYEEAFRAAHTIKGICQNLGFTKLFDAVEPLTEALRGGSAPADKSLVDRFCEDYSQTVSVIRSFQAEL